jgi:hypothetical protein
VTGTPRQSDPEGVDTGAHRPSPSRTLAFTIVPRRVFRALLLTTAVLLALSLAGQGMVYFLPDFLGRDAAANFLYVDFEQSIPTLYSALMFVVSSVLFGAIAHAHARGDRAFVPFWVFLCLLSVVLALDEFGSLHERMTVLFRELLDIRGGLLFHYTWVVPGAAVVALLVAAFIPFLRHLPRTTRHGLGGAAILFITGAIGVELLGGFFAADEGKLNMGFVLIVTVEEALEMVGLAVLTATLLAYIPVGLPDAAWLLRVADRPDRQKP